MGIGCGAASAPRDAAAGRYGDQVVTPAADAAARLLGHAALAARRTLAVAESLTSGQVCSAVGATEDSSTWFRGGLVAYASEVKFEVLAVPVGPVVSETAALAMAAGVRRLLGADLGVAVTGVGGPDEQDGVPPGTVWLATSGPGGDRARRLQLEGPPEAVVAAATEHAIRMALEAITSPGSGA